MTAGRVSTKSSAQAPRGSVLGLEGSAPAAWRDEDTAPAQAGGQLAGSSSAGRELRCAALRCGGTAGLRQFEPNRG